MPTLGEKKVCKAKNVFNIWLPATTIFIIASSTSSEEISSSLHLNPIPAWWIFLTCHLTYHLRILFHLLSPVSSTFPSLLFFVSGNKHPHVSSILRKFSLVPIYCFIPKPLLISSLKPNFFKYIYLPQISRFYHSLTRCNLATASLPFLWNCFHWGQMISCNCFQFFYNLSMINLA